MKMKEENDKRNAAAAAMSIQAAAAAVANDARRARLEEWKRNRSSTTEGSTGTSPGTSCASSVSSISEAVAISPRMSTSTAAASSRRQRSLTSSSTSSSQSGDAKLAPPAETRASTLRKNMNASQSNLKRSTSSTSLPAKTKAISPSSSYLRSKPRRSSSVSSGISPRQYTPSTKPKHKKLAVKVSATPTIHSSFEHHPHATSSVDDENIISTILSNSENSLQLEEEDEEDDISIYSCQSTPAIPTSSILGSLWSSLNRSSHHDIVLEATAVHSNCPSPQSTNGDYPPPDNNATTSKLSYFLSRKQPTPPDNSIQLLQSKNASLQTQLQSKQAELDSLTSRLSSIGLEKNQLQLDAAFHHEELTNVQAMNETLTQELEEMTQEKWNLWEQNRLLQEQLLEMDAVKDAKRAMEVELHTNQSSWQTEKEQMKTEYETLVQKLKFDLRVSKHKHDILSRNAAVDTSVDSSQEDDVATLQAKLEEQDETIMELQSKLLENEEKRRSMHNQIQELRGNVRVYVRTRPFLTHHDFTSGDRMEEKKECCELSCPINIHPSGTSLTILNKEKEEQLFSLDKVFAPTVSQKEVFEEVADFVQSAIDGYNVCLFSYGQTGSGKTHTMQGCGNADMRGIIPRAVELILDSLKGRSGWDFTLEASFLEIYNEELKDLLVAVPNTPWDSASTNNSTDGSDSRKALKNTNDKNKLSIKKNKLSIKKNTDGRTYVKHLRHVPIDTTNATSGMATLENVMTCAARSRSVAFTHMNATSSRSHSVFSLHIRGTNLENGLVARGTLNLCDLAGSERLDRSNHDLSTPEGMARLKETQSINKSLSTLGDVFGALSAGSSHVPYRNSKLTYLLQDCLGGDGKALMFVNLSPTVESSFESLCSLRFAQRVNQVELGRATRDVSQGSSSGGGTTATSASPS